jgi:AraC-like DNA-binding protein
MSQSASSFKQSVPFLWVIGRQDRLYPEGLAYAFDKAPKHPKNNYLLIDAGHMDTSLKAADEKLLKAITSMHSEPSKPWTLESLAEVAGMSRASFANHFREATKTTPVEYLTDWRICLAKSKITDGLSIKTTARQVGYTSPAALTRVFTKRVGCSPRDWLSRSTESEKH